MPVIYKLYEKCKEFAEEEEQLELIKKNNIDKKKYPYDLNNLKKIKTINEIPIDILLLKTGNILIINEDNKIKIYDNDFEIILFEAIYNYIQNQIIFCKYFPSFGKLDNDFLYLFTYKEVIIYNISYLSKKISKNYSKTKINGNIILNFIQKIESINDVIEIPDYENSIFFINNKEKEYLLYEYKKVKKENKISLKFNKKIIKQNSGNIFRRLYQINFKKFIIASYTLKIKKDDNYIIEGINKMYFINSENFNITKSFNIKISPLKYSISNYKDNFIILSYFNTIGNNNKKKNKINEYKDKIMKDEEQYNFEDNKYIRIFHNIFHSEKVYQLDDFDLLYGYIDKYETKYDYDTYENKYYSYDILEHNIGIFNIRTEELVTIIDFDIIKRIYNINNNLLCFLEKTLKKKNIDQIANERIFHHYFNDIPIKEGNSAKYYKRVNYLTFLSFDEGIKISQDNYNDSKITCFTEINKNFIAIGSKKKGLILYKNS